MNKKKTENLYEQDKARALAGVEFGKWLFMGGSTMPDNTIVTKLADTIRAHGLELNLYNWVMVKNYSRDFLLSTCEECVNK